MNVVELRCHAPQLASIMTELRSWLDHRAAETSRFELVSLRVGGVAIRLQFREPSHATICASRFDGKILGEPQPPVLP
jgi:hypothetical protein